MFRNHLRTALRGLLRSRVHSIINIGGLAVGMAIAILIGLWIRDELSFDRYHKNYNRIVQVLQKWQFLGNTKVWDHLPYQLLSAIKKDYGGSFKHIVAAIPAQGLYLAAGTAKKLSAEGWYMDADAPDMFTLRMHGGNRNGLADPHSIMLSASTATALFGDADPLGRTITLDYPWD